jgi:cyclic lactone autoinducer peptide
MNAVVRIFLKPMLALAVFAVLIASVSSCWFYFYSGDIPHFSELAELAPDSASTVLPTNSSDMN